MPESPLISVVIPTFNRAKSLADAISSALAQTDANFEIVISDNCSQDETPEIVKSFLTDNRVRYFRNDENIGMVKNWRRAVYELSRGQWFMILSDDDYLVDQFYLRDAMRLIQSRENVLLAYARGYLLDESNGNRTELVLPFSGVVSGRDVFLSRGTVSPQDMTLCNVLFHRMASIELDAFSNSNNISCDSELFLNLCLRGNVAAINDRPVSVYKFHAGNLIKSWNKSVALVCGNLDSIINPYLNASREMDTISLETYMRNVLLPSTAGCLRNLIRLDWRKYIEVRDQLRKKIPREMRVLYSSPSFLVKLMIVRLLVCKNRVRRFCGV